MADRKKQPSIVVVGDLAIDWYVYEYDPVSQNSQALHNWQLQRGTRMLPAPGGALQLAKLVELATSLPVSTHKVEDIYNIPPSEIIHSIAELDLFQRGTDGSKVFRISRYRGFCGPEQGTDSNVVPVWNDKQDPLLLVIDDAGNGFRDRPERWPKSLQKTGAETTVILKMSRPLATGELWNKIHDLYSTNQLIVVIGANDLRADSMNISRHLSWERTATDFLWQLWTDPKFSKLANCSNLIVRFGVEGAISVARKDGTTDAILFFDPAHVEDELFPAGQGTMTGLSSAFVASIAASVVQNGIDGLYAGIRAGLMSARRLFNPGFGSSDHPDLSPCAEIFRSDTVHEEGTISQVPIPIPVSAVSADPNYWCILKTLKPARLNAIARDIVMLGETVALQDVPVAAFGKLKTADRSEIESFRSIKNLLQEYVRDHSPRPPLSIAVFGRPGSGKSFGVTQVAESIDRDRIRKIEFNLSQFTSTDDLISSFHIVRDVSLSGRLPLIFFDEFDSNFHGKLGWLKYFLAPMQDGVFKQGETLHPIGKAVFVFAGGTQPTYEAFVAQKELEEAKGTDFISRLRGYVNILGPDPVPGLADSFAIIRRAMVLRNLIESNHRLLDSNQHPRIAEEVLRAFLKIPAYKHGARSMQAILQMSMVQEHGALEPSALPPLSQLKLHVDPDAFMRFVLRDVIFSGYQEKIAKTIHERYRKENRSSKAADHPAIKPWEELPELYKNSNRNQAAHILMKLQQIACDFAPLTEGVSPANFEFYQEEIDLLSEMEHQRYLEERRPHGFELGPDDPDGKTNPDLLPWEELSEAAREKDRQAVRNLPEILAEAGFYIYRLE